MLAHRLLAIATLALGLAACIDLSTPDQNDGVCDESETHGWRCSPDGTQRVSCASGSKNAEVCEPGRRCQINADDLGACMPTGLGAPCDERGACEGQYHCDDGICRQRCLMSGSSQECLLYGHSCQKEQRGNVAVCSDYESPRPTNPPGKICCKTCSQGRPCGDTCIDASKSCNVGIGCACW